MPRGIRAIILNTDEKYSLELRSQFLTNDRLKIVAELDEPVLLDNAIKQFPADLIVINLDTDPETLTEAAKQITTDYPKLTLFAVSSSENPQLILQAMRNGFREFLVRPIDETQLAEALGRITVSASEQQEPGKLICTLGAVGGVGTTTIATNLGCELAQMPNTSAVIIDLDMYFGHVATLLDLNPQFSISDLCLTLDAIDPGMIKKALIKHDCGVDVLARPPHFHQAEQISASNIATVINALCSMYDYVICDGPNRDEAVRPCILDLADTTLIPLNLTVPAVRNLDRLIQAMNQEGYNMNRTQLILSRHTRDNNSLSIEDVELSLNRKIAFTVPEEIRVISAAVNTGQPLLQCAPKSKVRESIQGIAQMIHDPEASEAADKAKAGNGLLARMLGK